MFYNDFGRQNQNLELYNVKKLINGEDECAKSRNCM